MLFIRKHSSGLLEKDAKLRIVLYSRSMKKVMEEFSRDMESSLERWHPYLPWIEDKLEQDVAF